MTFSYNKPALLPEALAFLAAEPTRFPVLAGGTDLIVQWRAGAVDLKGVIDIGALSELKKIEKGDKFIQIGALATHSEIAQSELVQKHIPVLAKACLSIGALQVQNRGTIGGNIMNASPAGDTPPVLLALGAEFKAQDLRGERWCPSEKFYTGYRKTALRSDELLTAVRIPIPSKDDRAGFYKMGTRRAQAISKVVLCAWGRIVHGGIENIAIAVGSVAPTVVRVHGTEALLRGKAITPAFVDMARRSIDDEVHPIDDIRSTADYRKHICGSLLARFLREASKKP